MKTPALLPPNDSLGLYIHVPFCRTKCKYCAFYSVEPVRGEIEGYLAALRAEMMLRSRDPRLYGKSFATLYIGGGTPSILVPLDLAEVSKLAMDHFSFEREPEVTVEANPESVGPEFAANVARQPGCRVSLGAQSFSPDVLRTLGRIHNPESIRRAAGILKRAGVRRVNLDLIYGTPGETLEGWLGSLEEALDLMPDHISTYCLSIEEGTPLAELVGGGAVSPTDDALQREMYVGGREKLEAAGYEGYEISNFAKPGARSMHNQLYWRRGEYVGLGPAAHSFIAGARSSNYVDVRRYCRSLANGEDPTNWRESISSEQALEETIMLALRTSGGLDLDDIERGWGAELRRDIVDRASSLMGEGLTAIVEARLRITPKGCFVSDEVIARLCPDL